MGEAKRRAEARLSEHAKIDAALHGFGIDTSQFGFYDQPAFLAQEKLDPAFLEQYARWVKLRPRTSDYDDRARAIVPRLAGLLADLFEDTGMHRSCVHASTMMPRILDRLGVWSFGLKGSFVSTVPSQGLWRGQAIQDIPDFPGAELGHAWIVAPPFVIVDPTIRLQNPAGDVINQFVPAILAIEEATVVRPTVDDVVSTELRAYIARQEGRADSQLHHRLEPTLRAFGRDFPSREARLGELVVRYVPAGVRVSDVPLEQINGADDRLTGAQVWVDHVAPAFADFLIS